MLLMATLFSFWMFKDISQKKKMFLLNLQVMSGTKLYVNLWNNLKSNSASFWNFLSFSLLMANTKTQAQKNPNYLK